jgi:hypothetical protein
MAHVGELLLRSCSTRGHRRAGGNGLLSLPILPVLVWRTGERFQSLEARGAADHIRSEHVATFQKAKLKPASVLCAMRRAPDDQPSNLGSCGCVYHDDSHHNLRFQRPLQL